MCLASTVGALLLSARTANAQRPLTGIWASDGYGQLFEFTADSPKSFEITKLMHSDRGVCRGADAAGRPRGVR